MTGNDELSALWFLMVFCVAILAMLGAEWIYETIKNRRR